MADFRGVRVLQLGVPFQYVATNVGTPAATLDHPTSERAVTFADFSIGAGLGGGEGSLGGNLTAVEMDSRLNINP